MDTTRRYFLKSFKTAALGLGAAGLSVGAGKQLYSRAKIQLNINDKGVTSKIIDGIAQESLVTSLDSETCAFQSKEKATDGKNALDPKKYEEAYLSCMRKGSRVFETSKLLMISALSALIAVIAAKRSVAYGTLAIDTKRNNNVGFRLGENSAFNADNIITKINPQFKVTDGPTPYATITLGKGDVVYSEPGSLLLKNDGIDIEVVTGSPNQGIKGRITRVMSGESLRTLRFTGSSDEPQQLVLNPSKGGHLTNINLTEKREIFCANGAFFAASNAVDIGLKRIPHTSFAILGGHGFTMQSIKLYHNRPASVLITSKGQIYERNLAPGEKMHVQRNALLAVTGDAKLDLFELKGVFTGIASGEGRFLTQVEGPGTIWVNSHVPDPKKESRPIAKLLFD